MLGKLIKHEFRATGRVFLPMYVILLVMSVVTRLFYSEGLFVTLTPEGVQQAGTALTISRVVVTTLMVMVFTAVWVVTLVLIIRRFWGNLLGREGYLMNVLPVNPWEHVTAKLIVSMVWNLLSSLFSIVALWIILGRVLSLGIPWDSVARELRTALAELRANGAGGQLTLLLAQVILLTLFSTASSILTAYAAMCLGQLVNRRRVLLSIGAYIGINTAVSAVGSSFSIRWFMGNSVFSPDFNPGSQREALALVNQQLLPMLLLTLAISALLFFVTQLLLKKELNLQ